MDKKVRFGIIGAGNMGSVHLESFLAGKIVNGAVAAIADLDKDKLEYVKKTHPGDYACYASGDELIDKADVDAVIVATPHYSHPPLTVKALNKGINVISEKPAGVYTKQVKEMNAVAAKSGKLFTIMFNQRTNPLYKKMREIVLSGGIGVIKRINWLITNWYRTQFYYDSGAWRATWEGEGGGVLFNQCPHQLDLLSWITGMMPSKIRAFCHFGKWHDIEVEDDVTAYLEYPNGATGAFITSTADSPGTNRFEILGTRGKLVCERDKLTIHLLAEDERVFIKTSQNAFREPECTVTEVPISGQNTQHVGIINNFANAVLGIEPLFVDGKEGLNGVVLMDAMLLSTWLDKTVTLPFDDDLYLSELNKRIAVSKKKSVKDIIIDNTSSFGGTR